MFHRIGSEVFVGEPPKQLEFLNGKTSEMKFGVGKSEK